MDLTQMKIFTAAAEALNFSSVAQQMFISQPTVTYQIKLLEKEVGQSLFKRSTHGVALTEAGTILYKNCATMCSMWENALISLRGLGPETDIRIGFSGNQFYEIASAFIPDYTQLEGSFHVILHSYPFEEKLRPLLANEVNFMFMFEYQIQDQEGLSMIPLSCSTFVAFMSKNHPLACREHIDYDDLTAQTIIISEEQKTHVPFQDILKKIKEPDFICVKDYSDQISTTLAQQGLMLSPCVLKFPASFNAVSIPFGNFGDIRRGLVYRSDDDRPTTKSMLQYFRQPRKEEVM